MSDSKNEKDAIEQLCEHLKTLKSIPISAIKFYLEHELKYNVISRETVADENKSFSFKPDLIDKAEYENIFYEFPKHYGYDDKGKLEFRIDQRKKYSWDAKEKLTKDDLQSLFDELQKQKLIRPIFLFEAELTDSEDYKDGKMYEFPKWWLQFSKDGIPKFLTKKSDKIKRFSQDKFDQAKFDQEHLTKLQFEKMFEHLQAQGLIRELK